MRLKSNSLSITFVRKGIYVEHAYTMYYTQTDLEEVSMMVTGTKSGKKSAGSRVGGSTGGTFSGNDSEAAVTIKLDFPVPRSPATTTRTPDRPPEVEYPAKPPDIGE